MVSIKNKVGDESRMRIWSRKTGYKPDRNWKDYRPYQYR